MLGIRTFLGARWRPNPGLWALSPLYWALATSHRVYMGASFKALQGRVFSQSRKSKPFTIPMVIVGALKAGGSGKTSVTLALARHFSASGLKVAILAYRLRSGASFGSDRDLVEVKENEDWRQSSEEALMLSRESGCRVFVTRHRARAWARLHDCQVHGPRPFDLILSDDGYQDPRLTGAFFLLLVEKGIRPGLFDLMPAGLFRETFAASRRSDLIIEGPYPLDPLHSIAKTPSATPRPTFPFPFFRNFLLPSDFDRRRDWIVLGSLGDNEPFFADLKREGIIPIAILEGRNHHEIDRDRMEALAKAYPHAGFLCTAKDFIKLEDETKARFSIQVANQTIHLDAEILKTLETYRKGFGK